MKIDLLFIDTCSRCGPKHGLAMLLIADQFEVLAPGENAETSWRQVAESLLVGFLTERS